MSYTHTSPTRGYGRDGHVYTPTTTNVYRQQGTNSRFVHDEYACYEGLTSGGGDFGRTERDYGTRNNTNQYGSGGAYRGNQSMELSSRDGEYYDRHEHGGSSGYPIYEDVEHSQYEKERERYGRDNGGDTRLQETAILGDDSEAEGEEEREMVQRERGGVSEDLPGGSSSEDETDDPEFIEHQEREKIIEMYDKGPDNVEIDVWENPENDIYKNMDRFGFVHKEAASPPLTQAELDKKRIEKELRREKKWLTMLKQWENRKPVKKLEERIWKGIPEKLRITVWPRLLGVEELKRQSKGNNVYNELLVRARLVSKDIKQIDLDINRTYRDHLAFRRRYDVKQQSLLNVLAAYSMYNTEVGYCQGMSQIAALFLMYLDEEDSFWCLHSLMVSPKHMMHGFFVPGFPKLQRFETHFKKVLKKYKGRVYKHLEKQDIPYIYLTKWWFGCFLDRVPFSLALRLWDVYILEGDVILIGMAINIMKMHEKSIRKLAIENFMEFVQSTIANDFGYPDDETMGSLREVLTKLRGDRLHHPPPPPDGSLPEVPTKAFGPVLSKSMADIRSHVAEVQSRCSRANSVANGRTPQPRRRGTNSSRGNIPPSPTVFQTKNKDSSGFTPTGKQVPFEVPLRRTPSDKRAWPSTPPPDPKQPLQERGERGGGYTQQSGANRGGIAMGIPAAGLLSQHGGQRQGNRGGREETQTNRQNTFRNNSIGSSPGVEQPPAPITRNRGSTYDNVPPVGHNGNTSMGGANGMSTVTTMRDDVTGKMVRVCRASDSDEDILAHTSFSRGGRNVTDSSEIRVTHAPNNITYVSVGGDDDSLPHSVV